MTQRGQSHQVDFFEFILIITSVIYALCVAPLLSGFLRVLQFDGQVKHCLPQILLSLYLFMVVVGVWWTAWWLRDVSWHFATYLYVILEPVLLYVACALIFPNKLDGDQFDMETHYYKVRVPMNPCIDPHESATASPCIQGSGSRSSGVLLLTLWNSRCHQ